MHSVGKRDDPRQSAIELPSTKRSWRKRRLVIACVAFCILPFVTMASEPASEGSSVSKAQTDASGDRSASASPSANASPNVVITTGAGDGAPGNAAKIPDEAEAAGDAAPFVNSLGMEFVPVPGTKVRFCRWDTRVSDWQAFIQEAGDTEQWGLYALDEKETGWVMREDLSWKKPGFEQTGLHPVVGVSWEDARRFCAWLSKKEGRTYRLPTDSEWSAAVGSQKYPWGDEFPPPQGAGNYCGSEARLKTNAGGTGGLAALDGYNDGFPRTSPVGSFAANRYGLYDMGGNVWQWCEDKYKASMNGAAVIKKIPALKEERASDGTPCRVLRGASWRNSHEIGLRSASRVSFDPRSRYDHNGFRCVVVIPAGTPAPKPSPSVELAGITPSAAPLPPKAAMTPKAPKAAAMDDLAIKELREVRKHLKEQQTKVAATLDHLLEWYGKGVAEGEVAAYNEQVRQAWTERDQVAAELEDVEANLRKSGRKQ